MILFKFKKSESEVYSIYCPDCGIKIVERNFRNNKCFDTCIDGKFKLAVIGKSGDTEKCFVVCNRCKTMSNVFWGAE